MEGSSVKPRALHILCEYWDRLRMVACTGGYYGAAFKGFRGVTQGDPLPPKSFNVVVDAVVRHWILLVKGGARGQEEWGREVQHRVAFFYVDEFLIVSTELVWLLGEFDTLTGLFERVRIQKNVGKMVRMICR